MAQSDAVTIVTGELFEEGWSRVRGSTQGAGQKQKQMTRAAAGNRAAVFKAIRSGGCSTKGQLSNQLDYLTSKSSHIVDSRGVLSRQGTFGKDEIKEVTDRFAERWDKGFNPKMGHSTHLLMSFPIGTRGKDVRDIATGVCERFFQTDERHFDYLIAVHEDRAHPHAHVVLNRKSQEGEFFYLGRDHHFNYDDFRIAMVEEAEKHGVRLEATRRVDRGVIAYPPRTAEVYAAKDEGRSPVARERVGRNLDRALAEIATASKIYRSLSAEASDESRDDIANALFRAGEMLARGGRVEQTGDIYMTNAETFDDLRGRLAEKSDRLEQFIREAPASTRAQYEKRLNAIYEKVAHMQPLGVRSQTLLQKPSDGGVYSETNINREMVAQAREPETRARIESALRDTGISSSTVIARLETRAANAALERQWLADDLEKIATHDGLNLDRREDLERSAAKLDRVHVDLGTTLERAEILRTDGVIETEREINFHYNDAQFENAARAIRQDMRGTGATETEIRARATEIEYRAYDRIETEQRAYLAHHPEIVATPREVLTTTASGDTEIANQKRTDQIDREVQRIMDRGDSNQSLAENVAADFKDRYTDMPDHLAAGLGDTYAAAFEANNRDALREADRQAAAEADHREDIAEGLRLDAATDRMEREGISAQERLDAENAAIRQGIEAEVARLRSEGYSRAYISERSHDIEAKVVEQVRGEGQAVETERERPEIARVLTHERAHTIGSPFPDRESREVYRQEIERELNDEQIKALKDGDSDVLDKVIDDRLDRLYAAKAYLKADETTANSEAVRDVAAEIASEEHEAQRIKHVHGVTEKGQTHG